MLLRQFVAVTSPHSLLLLAPGLPAGWQPCAAGFRGAFIVGVYAMWSRSEAGAQADRDEEHIAWARATIAALRPHSIGTYINETMFLGEDSLQDCFEPEAFERLRGIKAEADPHAILRPLQ